MTCIVLTKNPNGQVVAITDDYGNIEQWEDRHDARNQMSTHRIIEAWGGWIVDLDEGEIWEL